MAVTVSLTIEVEAENQEQAERLAIDKFDREEMFHLSHYDSVWEKEVTEVNEREDGDEKDGIIGNWSDGFKAAVLYVRSQMEPEDLAIIRAQVDKNYNQHMNPACGIDDTKITDLLEEWGDDHDMGEGWYLDEYDADDVMLII